MENVENIVENNANPTYIKELDSVSFKQEVSRALACIDQKASSYNACILFDIDGSVVGTNGFILYKGKLNFKLDHKLVFKGEHLKSLVDILDSKRPYRLEWNTETNEFKYMNQSMIIKPVLNQFYPNYNDAFPNYGPEDQRVSNLIFNSDQFLRVLKSIGKGINFEISLGRDEKDPCIISIIDEPGKYVIMPVS
jgi:hypothetical protein